MTLRVSGAELSDVLKEALADTGLAYLITERQITIYNKSTPAPKAAPKPVSQQNDAKQGIVVNGNVSDNRGEPLPV